MYQTFPGWQTPIAAVKTYAELPENTRKYIEFIETFLGVPIEWIGVGPGRTEMIRKPL